MLERELGEVESSAKALAEKDLPALNQALGKAGAQPIAAAEASERGRQYAALESLKSLDERASAVTRAERD